MKRATRDTARILVWLATAVVFLLVAVLPAGYSLIAYRYTVGALEAEAEITSRIVTQIINANPRLWQYEQVRLLEYLSLRPSTGQLEVRTVRDHSGTVIAESADPLPRPHIVRHAPLYDAGVAVGTLSITRSLRPLLMDSLLLFLVLSPFGITAFMLIYRVPVRAIRENEQLLRRERDAAQRYLDVAGVMILALDREARPTLINRKGCSILGLFETAIIGKPWFETFIPDEDRQESREHYDRLVAGGSGQFVTYAGPVRTGSGERRILSWSVIVLGDDEDRFTGTLWSGEDITDRMQLELELRQAQKLEAIGQLAGGVAHDFNNILAAIIGFGSLVHMKMAREDPLRHYIDEILAASKRAASITQRLLAFSRKQIIRPQEVDLNEIIRFSLRMLHRLLRADIELITDLAPVPLVIMADSVQIDQVLLNLTSNARDAMPDGGRLTIRTEQVSITAERAAVEGLDQSGVHVRLTVTDTGHGMDESTLRRIFEPLYTTKEVGKGTGLGLASVYGIVKQHRGVITVSSAREQGTTFTVLLPLVASAAAPRQADETPLLVHGDGTILLAEDEAPVRAAMRSVLEAAGYEVLEAKDGTEAVEVFRRHQERIALLVTDVIMPKKNGRVVLEEIRALRPGMKALFVSGYSADILHTQKDLAEGYTFISKPVNARDLLRTVKELLER
jgi:PAS domain S-box-containing protein